MKNTVLFVDDEINVLRSLERLFVQEDIRTLTATSASEAADIMKNNKVAVIVTDNLMPGTNGIDLLQRAKDISPESIRILMTAHADLQSAIDAINKGEVYKFLTKPWSDSELRDVVFEAVKRHQLILSLKRADEATLLSLAQTIELKDPYTKGHCDRVAQYALMIAGAMGLPEEEQEYIKYGSWLHDCGKIGVPESILNHQGPLSPEQFEVVKKHSRWGADVVRLAKLPEIVINIILYHHERYNGKGYPLGLKGDDIPLEARIVAVADAYDALTSDRPYRRRISAKEAAAILKEAKGSAFDPKIVEIFTMFVGEE